MKNKPTEFKRIHRNNWKKEKQKENKEVKLPLIKLDAYPKSGGKIPFWLRFGFFTRRQTPDKKRQYYKGFNLLNMARFAAYGGLGYIYFVSQNKYVLLGLVVMLIITDELMAESASKMSETINRNITNGVQMAQLVGIMAEEMEDLESQVRGKKSRMRHKTKGMFLKELLAAKEEGKKESKDETVRKSSVTDTKP